MWAVLFKTNTKVLTLVPVKPWPEPGHKGKLVTHDPAYELQS